MSKNVSSNDLNQLPVYCIRPELNNTTKLKAESNQYKEQKKRVKKAFDIGLCFLIRTVFILQLIFIIYALCSTLNDLSYISLTVGIVIIVLDGIFVAFKRHGKEYTWFSISTFSYTVMLLVAIWSLMFFKYENFGHKCGKLNASNRAQSFFFNTNSMDVCSLLELFVSGFVLTILFSRWAYPVRKKVNKEEISNLLLAFATNGADLVEFFGYTDETDISLNFAVVYAILVLFSIGSAQFSFTLIMRRKTDSSNVGISKALDIIFGTEIWSLLFSLLTQDTPFFIMRFFILVNYDSTSKNYTLYFFVIKNFALCLFEIYRIIILFSRSNKKKGSIQI